MPFQSVVPVTPAIGIPGDFASTNPRQHLVSGTTDQYMVAGAAGVTVGRFAILTDTGAVNSITTVGVVTASRIGFVHRNFGSAFITVWLAESSMVIPPGQPVELFSHGDFFAVADAVTGTPDRGAAVMWNPATGLINIGAALSGTAVDTGFVLLSESAVAGQTVMIGRQNPFAPASL